ncbi:S-adenosyl-L-methionine-dependent methyltransferase [Stereum hirsutum FP-91666 SS1]|uniref:S-adenosyl-L-methionine-dependent methyltransferase n=1 Tax=Stereum hirsutum (strain FP-91666) TaxID=721885 RepID=UPI000440FCC1|nr:S-adenosyl-L-methionine-dependent methyltransferase [Stereum hirsutum FP-91666 SS1]EIM90969.1 S-adenosyl-L-methionine-dependent methyltransferase [Stereum hirsutum FP-91666 SS1]
MNFYFEAADALDRLDAKQGSIKSIINTLPAKDRKRSAALVIETLKYKAVLLDVISAAKILEERKITSKNLALVLVHDLLLSRGIQAGDGPVKQAILKHKTRLRSEFQRAKIKRGVRSDEELAQTDDVRAGESWGLRKVSTATKPTLSARIPRYVRVNTLKSTHEEVVNVLQSRGYQVGDPLQAKHYALDEHIPELLSLPPNIQFHDDPLYFSGKIILQDKASCFPAAVLAPPATDTAVVIDATAAPGNKTSHLSALMRNKGKLFAFERDRKRFTTLQSMLSKAGCKNTEALNVDFTNIEPTNSNYSQVTHILLDPSCSGSGIVNRLDYLLDTEEETDSVHQDRLSKLSAFQLTMIKHAMKFPSVQKIVYSTCSVHAAENEHVVHQALNSEEAALGHFVLAPRSQVLPSWHRRGLPSDMKSDNPDDADSLIRCSPGEDATNGFFVSCFVKSIPDQAQGSLHPEHESSPPSRTIELVKRKRTESNGLTGDSGQSSGTKKKKKRKTRKSSLGQPPAAGS